MKNENLSYLFYKRMARNYLITPLLIDLFLIILVLIEISLWPYYLIIASLIMVLFLPLIILMEIRKKKVKKAEDGSILEGRIIKLEAELSFTFKSYLKAYVEIKENGKFIIITYPILEPKNADSYLNKLVQVAVVNENKGYILSIIKE